MNDKSRQLGSVYLQSDVVTEDVLMKIYKMNFFDFAHQPTGYTDRLSDELTDCLMESGVRGVDFLE